MRVRSKSLKSLKLALIAGFILAFPITFAAVTMAYPCQEISLQTYNGAAFNIQDGFLCYNSDKPHKAMMSGKRVCCEVVKTNAAL